MCNLQDKIKRKRVKLIFVYFSYLAETPLACKEKVSRLLDYMLSIEGVDEPRYSNFDNMVVNYCLMNSF